MTPFGRDASAAAAAQLIGASGHPVLEAGAGLGAEIGNCGAQAAEEASRPKGITPGGFTILEILLAIAMIGLISAATIGFSTHMMNGRALTAEEIFWKATQSARKSAVLRGHDVRLTFDSKAKAFDLDDGNGVKAIAIPAATAGTSVDFLSTQSGASAMMLGGTVVETQTIPSVTFFADGTCVPFRVQFQDKSGAHTQDIDEWTCAQVLASPNPNGGTASR